MAMMKYGRASKAISAISNGNGDGDKKVGPGDGTKNTQPQTGKTGGTTWEDYGKYITSKKNNEQAEIDYKNQLESYQKQIDYYNQGPEPEKETQGSIKLSKGGKTRKGADVTFESGDRYSAAQSNADLDKAMKENKDIVDINDPSINPTSRKIWMEQVGQDYKDLGNSNLYGTTTGNLYVNRSEINKIKSNVDIYGEPFDMREWRKASASKNPGDFDKYLDQSGLRNRTIMAKDGMGAYQRYNQPQMPTKQETEVPVPPPGPPPTVEFKIGGFRVPVPLTDTQPDPKPLLSKKLATSMAIKKGMKSEVEVPQEKTWNAPVPKKTKKTILKSATHDNDAPKGFGLKGKGSSGVDLHIFTKRIKTENTKGGYGILTENNVVEVPGGLKYKREQRLAKSFYAPTSELGYGSFYDAGDQGFDDQGRSVGAKKIVKSKIKDIRSDKREFRRETDMTGEEKRAKLDLYNADLKQGRESKRYTSLGKLTSAGGTEWQAGDKSRLEYFTPDRNALNPRTRSAKKALKEQGSTGAMSGYLESAQSNVNRYNAFKANEEISNSNAELLSKYGKNTKAEEWYQKAEDNATNRNTVMAQMENYKGWDKKIK